MESVAETSEEFMDRYFEGDEFSVTEVSAALAANVQDASIVPVCMELWNFDRLGTLKNI